MPRDKARAPGARGKAEEAPRRRDLSAGKRPLTGTLPAGAAPDGEAPENRGTQPRAGWFLGHFMPPTGEPEGGEASPAPDPAVHDHAGRLRQLADPKDPANPNNTLGPQDMHTAWLDLWTSRDDRARPRREQLEQQIRARNPADYADKMDMFRAGRRDALGAEYEAAADEADRCTAQLSVMNDVLEWLEARKAMGEHVTLDQVSLRALETARAKAIYVNTLMTAFLVGHPSALGGRAPRAAAHGRGTREEARRAIIEPAKFRYLFGQAGGRAHNVARTAQNAGQLARIGVYDTAEGRAMLQAHFERVAADSSNIARTFSNEYGTFQVRESLFTGPGGHVKFESTWQVLEGGGLRLTAAIPFGGP